MRMNDQIKCKIVALIGGVLLMIAPVFVGAQQKVSDVRVVVRDVRQERDSIRALLEIEVIGVSVAPREQMYLYPVLRYQWQDSGSGCGPGGKALRACRTCICFFLHEGAEAFSSKDCL